MSARAVIAAAALAVASLFTLAGPVELPAGAATAAPASHTAAHPNGEVWNGPDGARPLALPTWFNWGSTSDHHGGKSCIIVWGGPSSGADKAKICGDGYAVVVGTASPAWARTVAAVNTLHPAAAHPARSCSFEMDVEAFPNSGKNVTAISNADSCSRSQRAIGRCKNGGSYTVKYGGAVEAPGQSSQTGSCASGWSLVSAGCQQYYDSAWHNLLWSWNAGAGDPNPGICDKDTP